ALAEGMGIASLACVATAAMREAEDGEAFRQEIRHETGLDLRIIDGQEEARLTAQGVLVGWPTAKGLVCDIGGSSLELAVVEDGRIGARASLPLGPFSLQQIPEAGRVAHIARLIAEVQQEIGARHEVIYLVGGSWRAIGRLDMRRRDYPMWVLHEYRMDCDAI